MKSYQRSFPVCLLALFASAAFGQAPDTGDALDFAVLGATVTCTTSVIAGDVGISPATAFTNTGCTIAGGMPAGTNEAAVDARADFLSAYGELAKKPCDVTIADAAFTNNAPALGPLPPGVYCFPAGVTFTDTTLTLDGSTNPNGIWIFKVGAALTGTNFSVVMAGGGQACNVYWVPGAGATFTTSAMKGNILAGGPTGSISLTGGALDGRALAKVAVTMTDSVVGCGGLAAALDALSCKADERLVCKPKKHRHDGDRDDDDDHKGHKHGRDNPFDKYHGRDNPFDKHDGKWGSNDGRDGRR